MNARTTRMMKEARALFWPWCVVTIAGGLPLVLSQSHPILLGSNIREISLFGFFGGIHLLAILSLARVYHAGVDSRFLMAYLRGAKPRLVRLSEHVPHCLS